MNIINCIPWVSSDLLIPGVRILDGEPGPAQHLHLLRVGRAQEPGSAQEEMALLQKYWLPHLKLDTVDQGDPIHLHHPCQPLPLASLSPAHPFPGCPSLPLTMTSLAPPEIPLLVPLPLPALHPLDLLSSLLDKTG